MTRQCQRITDSSRKAPEHWTFHIHMHMGSGHHGSPTQALPTAPQAAGPPEFRNTVLTLVARRPGMRLQVQLMTQCVHVTGLSSASECLGLSAGTRKRTASATWVWLRTLLRPFVRAPRSLTWVMSLRMVQKIRTKQTRKRLGTSLTCHPHVTVAFVLNPSRCGSVCSKRCHDVCNEQTRNLV